MLTRKQMINLGYDDRSIKEYFSYYERNSKKPKKKKKLSKFSKNYIKYMKSPEWANIKIDIYASRGRFCEICSCTGKLEVHHKTYKNFSKEEPDDLQILCKSCHEKVHIKKNHIKPNKK